MKYSVSLTILVFLFLTNATIFSKTLGKCSGYLQIGKNPIEITKEGFSKAVSKYQSKPDHRIIRVLAMVNSQFDPAMVTNYGWKYRSRICNDIVELEGPAETAPYLTALDGLLYAKMPSRIYSCMDSARKSTHVDEVHGNVPGNLPKAYMGEGVLVGILETEFDTHHPAFLDSKGSSRFVAIWDQADSTKPLSKYGYGSIKNHDQIDADPSFALHGSDVHGTWVAGLAAGSMVTSNPYYGVAPKATLIGVKYGTGDNDLTDGIKWIFSIADSLHMPCVINMSIGIQEGPHDGTSLMDKIIDSLSGKGKIIVGAAGNDGDKRAHLKFTLNKNETKGTWITPELRQISAAVKHSVSGIDLWGKMGIYYSATFYVLDTSTMEYHQLQPSISTSTLKNLPKQYIDTLFLPNTKKGTNDTLVFEAVAERQSTLNNKVHVEAIFSLSNPDLIAGINITNTSSTPDTVQAWNIRKESFESYGLTGYFGGDSTMSVNEIGGTSKRNITVGAYNSKFRLVLWDGSVHGSENSDRGITHYSSYGPTVDGRTKPDICAPGSEVVGPLSSMGTDDNIVLWPDPKTKYGRYAFSGGTSLAAPIISGIVALMLQVKPTLSPEEIKQILQQTATTDAFTGNITSGNNVWGAGKVNALKAIQTLLGVSGNRVTLPSDSKELQMHFLGRAIMVTGGMPDNFPCEAAWYTINGKLIKKQIVKEDRIIDYPEAASRQVYILKFHTQNAIKTICWQKP